MHRLGFRAGPDEIEYAERNRRVNRQVARDFF
jgi:hypothetical protein